VAPYDRRVTDQGVGDLSVNRFGPTDGSAPRVVFVHGAMDRAGSFRRVVKALPELRLVTYDRRGYGRSIEVPPAPSLADQVADLLAVVGDQPATVVAHSFGGHIAVEAALAAPGRIRSLGLWEAPMPWLDHWPEGTLAGVATRAADPDAGAVAEGVYAGLQGASAWKRLPADLKELRRREGAALQSDLCIDLAVEPDSVQRWAGLAVPCLVGYGLQSRPGYRASALALADLVGAPVFSLDGADHGAHVSHPVQFAEFVRRAVVLAG
jgi:pimeloyl-ACP methyl ester carboxylesterase